MPNYVYTRSFFEDALGQCNPMWLVSPKRYSYKSPKHLREDRNSKQRAYTSPTHTFWYCVLFSDQKKAIKAYAEDKSVKSVLCSSVKEIPEYAQSKDKDTPLARFRGGFHSICKEDGLGKLCIEWALQGKCSCNPVRRGAFLHPLRAQMKPLAGTIRTFLGSNPLPDDSGWVLRPELAGAE